MDGVAALDFLHHEGRYKNAPRPDLVLLDLNLPGQTGRSAGRDKVRSGVAPLSPS